MVAEQEISDTMKEYVEHIYRLEKEHGVARTKNIAERVGVSLGTVTNTIDVLKRRELVIHKPYRGVKLTDVGRRVALRVLRRHRLSECLLTDILKMEWSEVHEHACRLEHAITDGLVKPLEKALGHPKTCPHGNPIPTMCGGILEEKSMPLKDLDEGEKGVVMKIVDESRELLEYLISMRLIPGAHIEVLARAPFDGPMTLNIDGRRHPISREVASVVRVKREG